MTLRPSPHSSEPSPPPPGTRVQIGRGRSGVVFAEGRPPDERLACKVFRPDRAASLVMTVLTGAANPYRWNRNAVRCALLRRRILERLVPTWFAGRVRLPRTAGTAWNEDLRAYELRAELIHGRHAMLRHPDAGDAALEMRRLRTEILPTLRRHLRAAGFDGLLWQAGQGNPVATANFMREDDEDTHSGREVEGGVGQSDERWVWIDLESGVPALFPLNPWQLLRTYLPLSIKHRRWLFDDVDVPRLRDHLEAHASTLQQTLPAEDLTALREDVTALDASQRAWRRAGRHHRSVGAALMGGRIDRRAARHHMRRPVRWVVRLLGRAALRAALLVVGLLVTVVRALAPRRVGAALGRWARFFLSQAVRTRWARRYVRRRALDWRKRGFLSREEARRIRAESLESDAGEYIADLGVHLAIKPLMKLIQWGLVPLLFATGVIGSAWLAAALVVGGGAIGRTLYTLGRSIQSLARGRRLPWAALAVGTVPVAGNAAYAVQLLAATRLGEARLARFLVHDVFSSIGRRAPIWGGRDTWIEHAANAVALPLTRR